MNQGGLWLAPLRSVKLRIIRFLTTAICITTRKKGSSQQEKKAWPSQQIATRATEEGPASPP